MPIRNDVDAPKCLKHPKGRVRRNGYYGKRRAYIKWQCVPDDGSRPHMLRPELTSKLVGGRDGCCIECEREWHETAGMPTGTRDRYTLREKAAALVRIAQGASFHDASEFVRRRAGYYRRRRGVLVTSRDDRLARDWVSQYTPILAERYLPRKWPRTLVLDKLPVHVRDTKSNKPRKSGQSSFFVFAALSHVGRGKNRKAVLWRVSVSRKTNQPAWEKFFKQLDGSPTFITCDRDDAMLNAIASTWPDAKVYPCVSHLRANVEAILRKGGLWDRRRLLTRVLSDDSVFNDPAKYRQFRLVAARYLRSDLSKLNDKQLDAMVRLRRWIDANEDDIARSLTEAHWPVSVGALERALRAIDNVLADRRAGLKNMQRFGHLLVLAQLHQMGYADERDWAVLLRKNHLDHAGTPPPRRLVDDPALERAEDSLPRPSVG